jgi:DHA3 family macrolide efflux protein-like MFS transporter
MSQGQLESSAWARPTKSCTGRMRNFYLLLVAHAVSLAGTHVTGFALSVWTYQQTGSINRYGAVLLSSIIPGILVAPVAGVLTDRWNRRVTLMLAHACGGFCALGMAIAYRRGVLSIEIIVPLLMVKSAFETIATLAFSASTATLVPQDRLDRANGMVQLGSGVAQIASPALAGLLLPTIGVGGIFLIDLVSFFYAVAVLAGVRIPDVRELPPSAWRSPRAFMRQAAEGLHYLRDQPALVGLGIIVSLVTFSMSAVQFLFGPLVLSFATLPELGFASSFAGGGLLVGSVALSIWGGPRRRVVGLLRFMSIQGALLFMAVAKPSVALAAIGGFGVFSLIPFIMGCSQALWQQTVPLDLQGRVFAFRMMLDQTMVMVALLLAGPLSKWLFEPWMAPGGRLAGVLGPLIGVGPGRGFALLIALLGGAIVATSVLARLYRPLSVLDASSNPLMSVSAPASELPRA